MTETQTPEKESSPDAESASAPPSPPANREGWDAPLETPAQRQAAVEAAFDYRGDVTIQTRDEQTGDQTYEGYMFDRHFDHEPPTVRMMLKEDGQRQTIPVAAITRLTFSGSDPAAGKSWETWVKKYVKKKTEEMQEQKA